MTSAPRVGTRTRRQPAPPGRIHVRREPPGEQDERDDDQADQRADQEAEQQGEPVLAPPEILDQSATPTYHATRDGLPARAFASFTSVTGGTGSS